MYLWFDFHTSNAHKIFYPLKKIYIRTITLIESSNYFINVTLVCDDDRLNAHKDSKPLKRYTNSKITLQWVL